MAAIKDTVVAMRIWLVLLLMLPGCAALDPEVQVLNTAGAASARPFSDGVRVDDVIYLSGTLGTDPATGNLVEGGIAAQTRQALENISRTLTRNGSSMAHVVKCTVMLADIGDYAEMNEVYVTFFPGLKPARSTFAAQGLALGARTEIECWAIIPR